MTSGKRINLIIQINEYANE